MGHCRQTVNRQSGTDVVLEVSDLSYHYGKKTALEQIGFTLQAGRFYALLGPNGAGKSTLFALLTRLFVAPQGEIRFFQGGQAASTSQALAQLGIVFQQSTLDLDLSVEQNLLYHGSLHGLSSRQVRDRFTSELARFGLQDRLKDKVRQLNGGHRRRLEIVRALLHQPRLLLLDEPTVGLDLESRAYLNQRVRELCAERDLCVLWATHLMEEVCSDDQVIVLHQGGIKAQASCHELCSTHEVNQIDQVFSRLTGDCYERGY